MKKKVNEILRTFNGHILTSISFFTASLGLREIDLGNIRRPSDRKGSELKPIIGFCFANNGLALLAVRRNVPSPPIGTTTSAQLVCFVESVILNQILLLLLL